MTDVAKIMIIITLMTVHFAKIMNIVATMNNFAKVINLIALVNNFAKIMTMIVIMNSYTLM